MNRSRSAGAIHKQRPYLGEQDTSQADPKNANRNPAREAESLLGCGRRAQIAEGPETERFQDTVLVFVH
jgi:hypothetical protein